VCFQLCFQLHAEEMDTIYVGVSSFEPFVINNDGVAEGFSVELFNEVIEEIGDVSVSFLMFNGVKEKIEAVKNGHVDVAIGGITVTSEREEKVDFSVPVYQTGLDIMVRKNSGGNYGAILKSMMPLIKKAGLMFIVFVVVIGHLVWFTERGKPTGIVDKYSGVESDFSYSYIPGIFEGMYFTLVTGSTVGYGDYAPKKWRGRIVTMLIIFFWIPLFAFFQAQLTAFSTKDVLNTDINGPSDLIGKRVSVINGTASADIVYNLGITEALGCSGIDSAIASLEEGIVDAVVYDAPALNYKAQSNDKIVVVGNEFVPQTFAYAIPHDSDLREKINIAILKVKESGKYDYINDRWFK